MTLGHDKLDVYRLSSTKKSIPIPIAISIPMKSKHSNSLQGTRAGSSSKLKRQTKWERSPPPSGRLLPHAGTLLFL